jgi:hypothetical protein
MIKNFALLFLIYYNIDNKMMKFMKHFNIYIHPKNINDINIKLKKYIIPNIIETKWADISIVYATINLLIESFKNINNKWFILLSGDSYPLFNPVMFFSKFFNIQNNKNLSIFFLVNQTNKIYKTSQFWILCRHDVEYIINNYKKYSNKIINEIKKQYILSALDELYFLSLLHWENNNYKYINYNIFYIRWISEIFMKSPIIFNKLTPYDIHNIKKSKSLFLRKITKTIITHFKLKKILLFITIGSLTNQNNYLNLYLLYDIIIISFIPIDQINILLVSNCIYIYTVIYKLYYESIYYIYKNHNEIIKQWIGVLFIPEVFSTDIHTIMKQLKTLDKKILTFNNISFLSYYLYDDKKNIVIYFNKKLLNI